ncbi:MAG: hypothetical protein GF344_05455 [Chitinivibrionales bacterium]|nr:hypothetical protein [Chitinivibrionales bacterium]
MIRILSALLLIIYAGSPAYSWGRKARVHLDYTRPKQWSYAMNYRAKCVIDEGGSNSNIDTRIMCRLTGKPNPDDSRLTFCIDSAAMNSGLYNPEQQEKIIDKLTGSRMGLALIRGCPVVDTLSSFSAEELSEWDLVIQFAKLLPDVPMRPVRKGYTWERNGIHPINTSLGTIPCEVYRSYKIEKLSARRDTAFISWRFRYAAADLAVDTSSILKRVPVSGTGGGTASIEVNDGTLLKAEVNFRTPLARVGDTKVYWTDNTVLSYLPDSLSPSN